MNEHVGPATSIHGSSVGFSSPPMIMAEEAHRLFSAMRLDSMGDTGIQSVNNSAIISIVSL